MKKRANILREQEQDEVDEQAPGARVLDRRFHNISRKTIKM
jgi:hypothetical protein